MASRRRGLIDTGTKAHDESGYAADVLGEVEPIEPLAGEDGTVGDGLRVAERRHDDAPDDQVVDRARRALPRDHLSDPQAERVQRLAADRNLIGGLWRSPLEHRRLDRALQGGEPESTDGPTSEGDAQRADVRDRPDVRVARQPGLGPPAAMSFELGLRLRVRDSGVPVDAVGVRGLGQVVEARREHDHGGHSEHGQGRADER